MNLAVELLNKNIFPETALELAMKASERRIKFRLRRYTCPSIPRE